VQGEIGDKCNFSGGSYYVGTMSSASGTFPVEAIWSNYRWYYHQWACVLSS